jgi:5-hydroxyisourate hydrolase
MADGYLTTHVLDAAGGCPAAGLRVDLYRIDGDGRTHVVTVTTNADGRTDAPLLGKGQMSVGSYELVFHASAYLGERHGVAGQPPFLDQVPIRFGISEPDRHYHVPLLLAPYSYSTYRGS